MQCLDGCIFSDNSAIQQQLEQAMIESVSRLLFMRQAILTSECARGITQCNQDGKSDSTVLSL